MLKRGIAIFLLMSLVLTNTELHQILKVPVLVSHYLKHKDANSTYSFISFLLEHYSEAKSINHDKDHERLPFKSNDCQNSMHSILFFGSIQEMNPSVTEISKEQIKYSNSFYLSDCLNSIWQPPQAV